MFETTHVVYVRLSSGIWIGTYKPIGIITLPIALKIVSDRCSPAAVRRLGKTMYIVICNPHGNTIEPEAAAFLASASGIRGIAAAAIVAPDHVTWQQGNTVVEVCMPGIPAALCQDISAAEKWLRDVMLANPHGATVRQKQVLKLVEKRFSHKEIAFKLGCKKRTVETHLYELQHRFGVTSVRDLIEAARQTGLLPLLNGSSS